MVGTAMNRVKFPLMICLQTSAASNLGRISHVAPVFKRQEGFIERNDYGAKRLVDIFIQLWYRTQCP